MFLRQVQFPHFLRDAGFPLVGYGHWNDVEGGEVGSDIPVSGKGEHLENGLAGFVVSVLGASVALGNPYGGVPFRKDISYVAGKMQGSLQEILGSSSSDNLEHTVTLPDICYYARLHEIVSESYFRTVKSLVVKSNLKQGRIQENIPVVGNKEIALAFLQILKTVPGKFCRGLFGNSLNGLIHKLFLKLANRLVGCKLRDFLFNFLRSVDIFDDLREILVCGNAFHRIRNLVVPVRTDIVPNIGNVSWSFVFHSH